MSKRSLLLIAALIVAACTRTETQSTTSSETSPVTNTSVAPAQASEIAQDLSTPESVLYDAAAAGPFKAVIEKVKSPADIGYDTKRKRVLVPHFTENKVTFHALQ